MRTEYVPKSALACPAFLACSKDIKARHEPLKGHHSHYSFLMVRESNGN